MPKAYRVQCVYYLYYSYCKDLYNHYTQDLKDLSTGLTLKNTKKTYSGTFLINLPSTFAGLWRKKKFEKSLWRRGLDIYRAAGYAGSMTKAIWVLMGVLLGTSVSADPNLVNNSAPRNELAARPFKGYGTLHVQAEEVQPEVAVQVYELSKWLKEVHDHLQKQER